ncbi:conserved hypothetical protein [Paraburkholderia tropica]
MLLAGALGCARCQHRLQMRVHALRVRLDAGEEAESVHGLIDRHAAAAERAAAACLGGFEQRRADREIDDVGHPQARVQILGGQRQPRQLGHAGRRAVNQAGGRRERRFERTARAHARLREAHLQFGGERVGARGVDVEQRERAGAHLQRRVRDRRARAARTQLHHRFERHVGQAALEGAREPRPVGVVADALAVAQQHRVDGAQRAGVVREFVEQLDHRLLAGIGDVQAVEAHALGREQQLGQRGGREFERVEIDATVDVVETEFAPFFLVHRGRERAADALADQAAKERARFVAVVLAHCVTCFANFVVNKVCMRSSAST